MGQRTPTVGLDGRGPLPDRVPARPRRHGGRVRRPRHAAGPRGRDQAAARGAGLRDGPRQVRVARRAILAGTSDPGLVTVLDAGISGDHPYLVMELLPGGTVADLVDRGAQPLDRVADIGAQAASALVPVHAAGVVHRDIEPGNLLFDEQGRVRLADFGIARLVGDSVRVTATGTTIGTATYLAPEQASGGEVGTAADIYALGLVLLELITGTPAFDGTPTEAALARLTHDPVVPDDLPDPLGRLLGAMTSREPAARPIAAEVAAELVTNEPRPGRGAGGPGGHRHPGRGHRGPAPCVVDTSQRPGRRAGRRRGRRRARVWRSASPTEALPPTPGRSVRPSRRPPQRCRLPSTERRSHARRSAGGRDRPVEHAPRRSSTSRSTTSRSITAPSRTSRSTTSRRSTTGPSATLAPLGWGHACRPVARRPVLPADGRLRGDRGPGPRLRRGHRRVVRRGTGAGDVPDRDGLRGDERLPRGRAGRPVPDRARRAAVRLRAADRARRRAHRDPQRRQPAPDRRQRHHRHHQRDHRRRRRPGLLDQRHPGAPGAPTE